MSSKDNTNPAPGHRRAKSHDVPSPTTMAIDGHPRPSLLGSVPTHPRVFGLGLGFGTSAASELGALAPAQAAPVTSTAVPPILGPDTGRPGEAVVSVSSPVRGWVSKPPSITATGAPLPTIIKGVTREDLAGPKVAAASPRPPVSKVAIQGVGSAAVRSQDVVASSSDFFRSLTRTVREEPDRVDRQIGPPPQLPEGFVSPRRRRDATIQAGFQTGLGRNTERQPVTPAHQVIPTYDQRREAEDEWLRREEQHRQEWERRQRLELGAAQFYAGAAYGQPFMVAGQGAPFAVAAATGPAFLGRPRGFSQASAIEQASAFGNVVPGPSHRPTLVSIPAGGYGAVDYQARIRSPRAAVGSYFESSGHGPHFGVPREESQGTQTEHPSPSTPEGMTREMYEAMCAFNEDVRQEQEEAVEEQEDEGRAAVAAAATAASLRMPIAGINQLGLLELPRGLTRVEFEAEQSQMMANAEAFSELVSAEEKEVVASREEAEDRRREAMGHRQPRAESPGVSESTYYGTGTLDGVLWQQAEDELWDVLNRRRVPSYNARGELVFPPSPTAGEIARERAAIFKRARQRAEEAEEESQGAGVGGEGPSGPNPNIPFGMPEDLYDQACAFSEQVRQEEAEHELAEGQAGPSQSPLLAPLACPGLIQWGVAEEGLIEAWRRHVARHPAESHALPAEAGREQYGARPSAHLGDPFDDRDVAAFSRGATTAARSAFVGRSGRSSARNATRGFHHPAEISTGSPHPRGRRVVAGEFLAPPEQTPLPTRYRSTGTPSPSVYSRTSGFGTVHAAVQRPVIGGVSGPDQDDIFGSPSVLSALVSSVTQRRNPSSLFEGVNSGSDRADEESSCEGREEVGGKGKMVVRNAVASRASSSSLSDGGSHGPRWVYESPSIGKMDSGPPRDKGKRVATAAEVAAQVAEEKLLLGTSASPAASARDEEEGAIMAPNPAVSLSETLLDDSGSRDGAGTPLPPPPPPPPSSAAVPAVVPLGAGAHRTLDLDEGFEFDAGILPPQSTRRKVKGGLRGLARGLKDALKPSSRKLASCSPAPTAAPLPEIPERRRAAQSVPGGLSPGGGRTSLFASLTGRSKSRPGSSASAHHRAPNAQVGGTGSLGSRRWPARRSSLARASSIPNLRGSPSVTADALNKPLPQTPLFVVRETSTTSSQASSHSDANLALQSAELSRPPVAAGQSLKRGRNVSFADRPAHAISWLRSESSVHETVPVGGEPSPVRAPQQRIEELEEAIQVAEGSRSAAEARAAAAEETLARALAELDVYVAQATEHQRALTAQRVDFQMQIGRLTEERDGAAALHAAEMERQHARHLDYLRVLGGGHLAERQGMEGQIAMLYSAIGGLQAQVLYLCSLQPGGAAAGARRQSLQQPPPPPQAPAAQQEGTAANEPPQQLPSTEFVPGPRLRFGSRLPVPGLFHILPHPIPPPPQQPPFAPSESVRQANRAGRLANEAGGPEYRRMRPRMADPNSD